MAKKLSPESGRAIVRQIGRVTVTRLIIYYIFAGAALLLLSSIFPEQPTTGAQAAPAAPAQMLDWFQNEVALFPGGAPRWVDALVQMLGALLLVLPLAFVYVRTRTRLKYDHSLVQTVIMLPIVVTAILVVVRNSLALAFSLAGIVAAVRFRNNLKESGDAVYIFGSIGIGFATGIHALSVAAVLSIVFVVVELALWKFNFSAEFEETFARLCMPSGADLEAISQATGEHPSADAGRGRGSRRGRRRQERRAPGLRGRGGAGEGHGRDDPRAGREALVFRADQRRRRRRQGPGVSGTSAEEHRSRCPARPVAA